MMKQLLFSVFLVLVLGCSEPSSESNSNESLNNDFNNSLIEAEKVSIGDTISIELSYSGDEDYYQVVLQEDAMLNFECLKFPIPSEKNVFVVDLFCSLLDSDGNEIHYSYNQELFTFNYNVKAGTYFFRIKSKHSSATTAEPGAIVLNLETVDLLENNDSIHLAKPLQFDTTYRAKLLPYSDNDYYSFTVNEKSLKTIRFDSIPDEIEFYAYLTDSDGNYIEEFLGTNSISHTQVFDKGTYLLKIHDRFYNNGSSSPYFFSVSDYNVDKNELNNSIETATPLELNKSIQGNIFPVGDLDYYSLTIPESDSVTFTISDIPSELSVLRFSIFNSSSEKLSTHSLIQYLEKWETKIEMEAGSYYICLFDGALMPKPVEELYTLAILQ